MKYLLLVSLFVSTTASAGTGSLWCAVSPYGTPTETAERGALPYRLIQIDKMSEVELQIDIEDLYFETNEVFNVTLATRTGASISDIAQGFYVGKRNIEVKVEQGKILIQDDPMTYNCEIPGDYRSNYSL